MSLAAYKTEIAILTNHQGFGYQGCEFNAKTVGAPFGDSCIIRIAMITGGGNDDTIVIGKNPLFGSLPNAGRTVIEEDRNAVCDVVGDASEAG